MSLSKVKTRDYPITDPRRGVNYIKTILNNYVISNEDKGWILEVDTAIATTLTLPALSVPIGSEIGIIRMGVGAVDVVAGTGVTLYPASPTSISSQYGTAVLYKLSDTEWLMDLGGSGGGGGGGGVNSVTASAPITSSGGANPNIAMPAATALVNGYLTSADWTTFNNKQSALSFGNLSEITSNVLTITGGTGAVIGGGTTVQVKQAGAGQDGFLSSADWSTFNNKQSAITLTTLGTSGAATFAAGTLNIPIYSTSLINWTEAFSSATQNTSSFTATNAAANINAAIVPKGTGAIVAAIPDGGITGGNTRGANAVDLQMLRTAATQVASGTGSFIGGGERNTASGALTAAVGGLANNVIGAQSFTGAGQLNNVTGSNSGIVAGNGNNISAGSTSFIGSGHSNTVSSTSAFIGSGQGNSVSSNFAVICGGGGTALGNSVSTANSFIGAGKSNTISGGGLDSFIGGGVGNSCTGEDGVICGGGATNAGNTVSARWGAILGGLRNIVSASLASITGGEGANANLHGQRANGAGAFSGANSGDAQTSSLTYRRTVTGTSAQELFLDGSSVRAALNLPTGATNARVWNARIDLVAIVATPGAGGLAVNEVFSGNYMCTIRRTAATTALIGAGVITNQEVYDTAMSSSIVTIDADTANGALRIQFTPPTTADANTVIRVVATAYLTEVGR